MQEAADSSLEIRIFGLPHRYAGDAIIAARTALKDIASRRPTLAQERWAITVGDPYARGPRAIQSSVRIRYSDSERQAERNSLEDMASLLEQLKDDGLEAFWSGAPRNDRRNIGDFIFNWSKESRRPIDRRAAFDLVERLCAQAGHEIAGLYDNFGREGNRGSLIFVKFVHVASVNLFEAYAQANGPWTLRGDTIQYSVPIDFASLTPTMIATCEASGEESCELEYELQGLVDEYNDMWLSDERILDTSTMWQGDIFLATCSSLALADFITTKDLIGHKAPYEYVYDLNENLFVPARRRLQYARMDARDRRYHGLEPEPPGARPVVRSTPPIRPPPRRPVVPSTNEPVAVTNMVFRQMRQDSLDQSRYEEALRKLRDVNSRIEGAVWKVEDGEYAVSSAWETYGDLESEEEGGGPISGMKGRALPQRALRREALRDIRKSETQLRELQSRLAEHKVAGRALVAERAIVERLLGENFRILLPMLAADDDTVAPSVPQTGIKRQAEDVETPPAQRPKMERAPEAE